METVRSMNIKKVVFIDVQPFYKYDECIGANHVGVCVEWIVLSQMRGKRKYTNEELFFS